MAKTRANASFQDKEIGLIAYELDRSLGGIGRYTRELSAALVSLQAIPVLLDTGGCTEGRRSVALRGTRLMPMLMTLGQIEIAYLARKHRLALIHDPTGTAPLLLTRASRVVTVHDAIPYIFPNACTRLEWLIYHLWLPGAVRCVDAVITVSQHSRDDILRFLPVQPEKVIVVPLAADTRYRPLDKQAIQPVLQRYGIEWPYILYVGSLEARKNLPRILEAYARLRQQLPVWKLVIVGAHRWQSSPIFQTVKRLQLEPYVHFSGFVQEDDLPAVYNGADLFVFPSLYEGFGLPVLEAMACGVPVITSNVSSLPEVAGDAAVLVDPMDVSAITATMQRVLCDSNLAADLRERGLKRASLFSWERTAQETLAVYERVLAEHKR